VSTKLFCDGCSLEILPNQARRYVQHAHAPNADAVRSARPGAELHGTSSCLVAWALQLRISTLPSRRSPAEKSEIESLAKDADALLGRLTSPFGRGL
jgi:hypothetical protein